MSNRNYITATKFHYFTGEDETIATQHLIEQAEMWVDRYIADFLYGNLRKSVMAVYGYGEVVCTDTTCTIPSTFSTGFFKNCVLEALNGTNAGQLINISNNSGNALEFDLVENFSDTTAVEIRQEAKFPMLKDVRELNGVIYKTIPQEVQEATAWQVSFMNANANLFSVGNIRSESIGESYSYTRGSVQEASNLTQYLSPVAIKNLSKYSTQTI